MPEVPDILILHTDQQRADCLGATGNKAIKTSNLDRLAKKGVLFTQAYTSSPLCMPARASFISGVYPHNHHMWDNRGALPADDETFFHHLQNFGYFTAHIGKSHYYQQTDVKDLREMEDYMKKRGLDYVHETTGPWRTVRTDSYMTDYWREKGLLKVFREDYKKRRERSAEVRPNPLPWEDYIDSYVGQKAVEFLESYQREKPLCLFVGFPGPHPPADAPGKYAEMYSPQDMPPPIKPAEPREWVPEKAVGLLRQGIKEEGWDLVGEAQFRKFRANYYGKISLIDYWIGKILDTLEEKGWLDNTLVVFWSDHGEMAGDHQRMAKKVFFDASVRVPLILSWPSRIKSEITTDALTSIIDVYPTLLDVAGVGTCGRSFGKSLFPMLENQEYEHHRKAVFSEVFSYNQYQTMILTEEYKYAINGAGNGYMLFDRKEDPLEQNNLVGHPDLKEVEKELRDKLLKFFQGTQYHL